MADITEVPLEIENNTEILEDNGENIKIDTAQVVEDNVEIPVPEEVKPIKAKAKGRPKGAPNRGPSKPRVKKTQIQEAPVEETIYEPSSPRRNLKIPTDPNSSDIAAAMLKLLQDQTYSRQSRKQRLYNSWFQ